MTNPANLYAVDLSQAAWRKSSYTANNGNCVEVAGVEGIIAVRDSKNTHIAPLRVSPQAWGAFVTAVATDSLTA